MSLQTELNLLEELMKQGRLNEARSKITAMLAHTPDEPGVLHAHAVIMWQSSHNDAAIASMKKAVEHAPEPVALLMPLAQMQHGIGDLDGALVSLRNLVKHTPDNPESLINLSGLLIEANRNEEALDVLSAAVKTFSNIADIHFNLGVVQKRLHQLTPAAESYLSAVKLAPENPHFCLSLGCALIDVQDYLRAVETLRPLAIKYPDNDDVADRLGFALTQSGKSEDAIDVYKKLAAKHPANTMVNERLMYNQMQLGHWQDAQKQCETILNLDPGNIGTLGYRKFILDETGSARAEDDLYNIEAWIKRQAITLPDGYKDLDHFNAQLAGDILAASLNGQETLAISCHNGKIVADLKQCEGAAIAAFVAAISEAMASYVKQFKPPADTSWSSNKPDDWEIYIWSTVLNDGGYQDSHMHPSAWVSGVYYVSLPQSMGNGSSSHDGWLEFGEAPARFNLSAPAKTQIIKPEPGLIVFFPSYFHHRTIPFKSTDHRISIAFDLEPRQTSR